MTTRTTAVFLVTLAGYTLLAHLCGATLPPKPYLVWASNIAPQAILCSNSSNIARWMGGPGKRQVDVYKTQAVFVLIVCLGSTYSTLANLMVHDGKVLGPRDGHEITLTMFTMVGEAVWTIAQPLSRSSIKIFRRAVGGC
jgi:hypothetical protein